MRLLIDAHVFDGMYQGTRTYIEGLYRQMVQYKDIDYFFAANNIDTIQRIFGQGENIHYLKLKSNSRISRLLFEFPKMIKKNHIDYAHFQYVTPIVKNCREIVTIHDILFKDFPQFFPLKYRIKNSFLFRLSAQKADILLTVSEYSQTAISKHFKIDKTSILITSNGILPSTLYTEENNVEKKYGLQKFILSVNRIEPRKNHLSLLRAYIETELYKQGYKLVFVGSSDLKYKEFFNYLYHLRNDQKAGVLFLSVTTEELIALYRNASLFVFPSYCEGFGIPPLEALAYGCVPLCSNTTAMAEFGFPDDLVFSPSDLNELKRKMVGLLSNKPDITNLRKRILKKYNWTINAQNYYNLLVKHYHI